MRLNSVSVIFIIILLFVAFGCQPPSSNGNNGSQEETEGTGGETESKTTFYIGDQIRFSTTNGSEILGTVIDLDGDEEPDGVDLDEDSSTLEFVFLSNTSSGASLQPILQSSDAEGATVYAVDTDGDAVADFYLRVLDFEEGTVELNTDSDGSGTIVKLIVNASGEVTGIDKDEDGSTDITVISLREITDATAPTPGNSGIITISNLLSASMTLSWTQASDNAVSAQYLKYKVVQSSSDNIATIAAANTEGDGRKTILNWTLTVRTLNVSGLEELKTYYFAILVKDPAGNMAIYQAFAQTTAELRLTGNWLDIGDDQMYLNYSSNNNAESPAVTVFDSKIYVTWKEKDEIRVKEWDGTDWSFIDGSSDSGINSDDAATPKLGFMGDDLYAIWTEDFEDEEYDDEEGVRVKKWDGSDWSSTTNWPGLNYYESSYDYHSGFHPALITYNAKLYAVWAEGFSSWYKYIRLKEWNGSDWTFIDDDDDRNGLNYTWKHTESASPEPIVFDSKLVMIWSETLCPYTYDPEIRQIRARRWDGGTNWTFIDGNTDFGLNYDPSNDAYNPSTTVFNSKLYLAWSEDNSSDVKQIRVKKWDGSSWSFIDGSSDAGLNYESGNSADYPFITSFDSKLFVAWSEYDGTDYILRIKEWDGDNWRFVDGNTADGLVYDSTKSKVDAQPKLIVYQSDLYILWIEKNANTSQKKLLRIKMAEME